MESAFEWKQYYAAERDRLGEPALQQLLDQAEPLTLQPGGAIVIPHTRLQITGDQIARAAQAIVASGVDRVLALGVLHGARRADASLVAAARLGDSAAIDALRGTHDEHGCAAEEFSLDAFKVMTHMAAVRAGRMIEVVPRYPFLVGDDPASMPGLDEVSSLLGAGTALVVTTDPIHHGHAYGSPASECCAEDDPETIRTAAGAIGAQMALLSEHRFAEFQAIAAQHHSDFRDTGPMMAWLLGPGFGHTVHDLALVDYSSALSAPRPSWVAGALISVER